MNIETVQDLKPHVYSGISEIVVLNETRDIMDHYFISESSDPEGDMDNFWEEYGDCCIENFALDEQVIWFDIKDHNYVATIEFWLESTE